MTYNPSFYAYDPEWAEWIAAEYEAQQAREDMQPCLAMWQDTRDDYTFALQQLYARTAASLASRIEDETDARLTAEENARFEREWF